MEGSRRSLGLLVFLQMYQGLMGELTIQASPANAVVSPGEDVTFMCRVIRNGEVSHDKLNACTFEIGGGSFFFLSNQVPPKNNVMYMGAGLDHGECGIKVSRVEERLNGKIKCSLLMDNEVVPLEGHMSLVVAIAPQKPKLEVTVASDGKRTYKERDTLSANCIIRDGRPVANISWYLDSELITAGLAMPLETCPLEKKELCTIQQNLTRTLQASDDKKVLRCVASHYAFKGNDLSDQYTIRVNYPPKEADHAFEFFGLVEGVVGRFPITVNANPQPVISWYIDDDKVSEGTKNGRYTVESTLEKAPGEFETTLLIDTLTKEDTDRKYKVFAHNEVGETQYLVSISTSPEPKVLEMGAGTIIIILVAVLLILLVLGGVFFARAKGKLCFAGHATQRIAGESSDTESAEQTSDPKPKLTFVSVFKVKGEKKDKEMLKCDQNLETKDKGDQVVYAELDLAKGPAVIVRGDDDKTEYAEIIHAQPSSK